MKKLFQLAAQSQGLRQSVLMVVGNLMATSISALSLILISRLVGPSLFGEFSVGFALIMIISRLNDAGITATLMKFVANADDSTQRNEYFSATIRLKLILSIVITSIGVVGAIPFSRLLNFDSPWLVLVAFVVGGLSATYFEQLTGMLQSLHRFQYAVVVNFIQASVKLLTAAVIVFFQFRQILPIFTLYAAAPLVPLLFSTFFFPKSVSFNVMKKYARARRQIITMAKHTGTGYIASTLSGQINVLFVQSFLTTYETGLLGGVSKIPLLFSLASMSLSNVLFPRVARYTLIQDLKNYLQKASLLLILIGGGFLITYILAPFLITFTVGNDYLPALSTLRILLAAAFAMIATVPFTALFYSLSDPKYFSITGIIQMLIVVGGNFLLVPVYGLIGSAIAELIARLAIFALTLSWAAWILRQKYLSTL
ncbi:MAG TPA: oligosaccharide flippase family protein [Patescibacteria group bacterium]